MIEVITTSKRQSTWADLKANECELRSGDIIPVTLKNGEEIDVEVAHDETGKTFFVFKDCMNERHFMNMRLTNKGAWDASDIRRYANNEVFDLLPDDLQAVIVPTKIVQTNVLVEDDIAESEDKLFLLSATQVFGTDWWSENEPNDTQLDIFKKAKNRVKKWRGSASWWWLRSANSGNYFSFVSTDGSDYISSADASGGVVLGFCINP